MNSNNDAKNKMLFVHAYKKSYTITILFDSSVFFSYYTTTTTAAAVSLAAAIPVACCPLPIADISISNSDVRV